MFSLEASLSSQFKLFWFIRKHEIILLMTCIYWFISLNQNWISFNSVDLPKTELGVWFSKNIFGNLRRGSVFYYLTQTQHNWPQYICCFLMTTALLVQVRSCEKGRILCVYFASDKNACVGIVEEDASLQTFPVVSKFSMSVHYRS